MNLPVVASAKWHGKFVADLSAQRLGLRKTKMMGVRWLPPADQTGLIAHKTQVRFVADPLRLTKGKHAFVDFLRLGFSKGCFRSMGKLLHQQAGALPRC